MEKIVTDAIKYRRSVRVFKNEAIDEKTVKSCIENAVLAPTSSNMQLWEFHHIVSEKTLDQMKSACLNQNAAKTASQLVVVVVRRDLWRKRAKFNASHLKALTGNKAEADYTKREKFAIRYYTKLIPILYSDFLGIVGWLKYIAFNLIGLFKPTYRQVRKSDLRIVAHKSAALAAQNFMISMAAHHYDTCPMEGSDTLQVKRILKLPAGAEINMVIGCGIRDGNKGIYTERYRVPFDDVYKKV